MPLDCWSNLSGGKSKGLLSSPGTRALLVRLPCLGGALRGLSWLFSPPGWWEGASLLAQKSIPVGCSLLPSQMCPGSFVPALLSPVPAQDCGSSLPPALQHTELGIFFSFEMNLS